MAMADPALSSGARRSGLTEHLHVSRVATPAADDRGRNQPVAAARSMRRAPPPRARMTCSIESTRAFWWRTASWPAHGAFLSANDSGWLDLPGHVRLPLDTSPPASGKPGCPGQLLLPWTRTLAGGRCSGVAPGCSGRWGRGSGASPDPAATRVGRRVGAEILLPRRRFR